MELNELIERLEMTKQVNDPFPAVLYELMQEAADHLKAMRDTNDKVPELFHGTNDELNKLKI